MPKEVVIIGAGGHARDILDICEACNQDKLTYEVLGFIVDQQYGSPGTRINDIPILGDFGWLEQQSARIFATCAVGDPQKRYWLTQRAYQVGCRFFNLIHPNAILTRWITLGEGVVITAGCVLTNQITIGNHVHINLGCTIAHDVVLEDFVTLSPGAHISGNVRIGPGCYVGTGANVIQKLRLGAWSVVGAGSAIVKDVPPNTTVVGVPGKVIKTRMPGWHLESDAN